MNKLFNDYSHLKKYFEWDVQIWGDALYLWRSELEKYKLAGDKSALEIGGRRGGLSYFLANEYQCNTICSDLQNPILTAKPLHSSYDQKLCISYEEQNCLNLTYPDNSFDIVIFKSVLGALGSIENQRIAISEIYRCLKPGGILCFAENLKSTSIHQYLRKWMNPWSSYWYYPSIEEFNSYLCDFSAVNIKTIGFTSLFVRNEKVKLVSSFFDKKIQSVIPNKWNYVIYGTAIK